jgi:hypothetical protein
VPPARSGGERGRELGDPGAVPRPPVPRDGDGERARGVWAARPRRRGGKGEGDERGAEEPGQTEEDACRGEGRRGEEPAERPRAARGSGRGGEEDLGRAGHGCVWGYRTLRALPLAPSGGGRGAGNATAAGSAE